MFFKDSSFIKSLYKVIDALGFSCITFFTYAPKSFKSYFVLNFLKLDDFMFSTKTVSNIFQTCLKGFKLKKLVVEPKTAQLVEPNEEPINPPTQPVNPPAQLVNGWKKHSFSFRTVVQPIKVRTVTNRNPTITYQLLNVND